MKIDKDQVVEKMKSGQVVVLNVLSRGAYNKLHIKGSESQPLVADFEVYSKEVEGKYGKDKPFIVYGDHFGLLESFMAARALENHGLEVLNYSGGVREWHRAGLPVEGTEAGLVPEAAP
jgi:rhodanese-related sulfurtransferase